MVTRLMANNGVVGEGVTFDRIRRVTGYLVGTLDRFNNGKRAEEHDRVKHSCGDRRESNVRQQVTSIVNAV